MTKSNLSLWLEDLNKKGINIRLKDNKLHLQAPKGVINKSIQEEISQRKSQIINHLKAQQFLILPDPYTTTSPLSNAQQRLWFLQKLVPNSAFYHISTVIQFNGPLQLPALEQAFNTIIQRHESLRTIPDPLKPIQYIHHEMPLKLHHSNVSNKKEALKHIQLELQKPFDLFNGPLLRVSCYQIKDTFLVHIALHHLIADAWSGGLFLAELSQLYSASISQQAIRLPALPLQYTHYCLWQEKWLESDTFYEQLKFWKQELNSLNPVSIMPDYPRPTRPLFKGKTIQQPLSKGLRQQLQTLAQQVETTLFVVMITALQILLYRYTHDEDIPIGFPIAGRHYKGVERLIGFFANTLILRQELQGQNNFFHLVQENHKKLITIYQHQDIPFDKMVEALQPDRQNYSPLFQTMFVMQNTPGELPSFAQLEYQILEMDNETSKFDLTLMVLDDHIRLEYDTTLYHSLTAEHFLSYYLNLLESLVFQLNTPIYQLQFGDSKAWLNQWPQQHIPTQPPITLLERFENIAHQHPDKPALTFENQQLTYGELDQQALTLSRAILEKTSTATLIGVCFEPGFDMIVTLLAVFKAGGAYLPLDPALPPERLEFILEDAKPQIILCGEELKPHFKMAYSLQELLSSPISPGQPKNPLSPNSLAYIIYTSGSTGQPNGVLVNQYQVSRLLDITESHFAMNATDVWLLFHSFAFDFAVWEIWGCLCSGGRLVILSHDHKRNPQRVYATLCQEKVTILNQTPSAFYPLSQIAIDSNLTHHLNWVILSGEALDTVLLNPWFKHFGDERPRIANSYGITETTVFVTFHRVKSSDASMLSRSPIGHPLNDLSLYVLDPFLQPLPPGVPGELYVGGEGVSQGYLNRKDLTAKRFIKHPFGESILYRSGDQVKALPDGSLAYIGRLDHQIKLRGYRIELGEIEAVLNQHPNITSSIVILQKNQKMKYLVAYYILENRPLDSSQLKTYLKRYLTSPMIPSHFIPMKSFPLTNNGKVNRQALPDPSLPEKKLSIHQSQLEQSIASILQELLNLSEIDRHTPFFELGAHSLLLVEAHQQIQQKTQRQFELIDFFQHPTLAEFTHFLQSQSPLKLQSSTIQSIRDEIAIIGISGRFPGASNLEVFWENLEQGICSIKRLSDDELKEAGVDEDLLKNPLYVKANGLLDHMEYFDANFFGYSPGEAKILDPQQRLMLECAWETLENAGYSSENSQSIGVFAGSAYGRYLMFHLATQSELVDTYGYFPLLTANDKDYLATRTAYKLNLTGPSMTIQTACSTSLVAVHMACKSLLNGECEMALAGGVSLDTQKTGYLYQEGSIASPDGYCRTFDAEAKGIVGGSGIGLVLLKPLTQALKDRDNIHAVIKSSAVNNDGKSKVSFLAPTIQGQAQVILDALTTAQISPESIQYIEAHGTGTPLGDPIEIKALTKAYHSMTEKKQYCGIGSVKTNIGHLDAAAGIAGLLKTVLSLKFKWMPPSLHYKHPNPQIDFKNSPFYVNDTLTKWPESEYPGRAGVSAFGVGGTNAHLIVEEAPENNPSEKEDQPQLLVLSAKTPQALEQYRQSFKHYFDSHSDIALNDVAFTLQRGRCHFKYRQAIVANTSQEATKIISAPIHSRQSSPQSIFVFSGHGQISPQMGAELYQYEEVFKSIFDECDSYLSQQQIDIFQLFKDTQINDPAFLQPALFSLEYTLAKLWISKGVQPHALIGHSMGELVAACISRACSLEAALEIVTLRGRLFKTLEGKNLIVFAKADDLYDLLSGDLYISAFNSPHNCLVTGPVAEVVMFQLKLEEKNIDNRMIAIDHPTHCPLLEDIAVQVGQLAAKVNWQPAEIPIISTVSGELKDNWSGYDWTNHMKKPVKFQQALSTLYQTIQPDILLEIGPARSIISLIKSHPDTPPESAIMPSLNPDGEYEQFLYSLGQCWSKGHNIEWPQQEAKRVPLPTYPFEKQYHWIKPQPLTSSSSPLKKQPFDKWFYSPSWKQMPLKELPPNSPESNWLIFSDNKAFITSYQQLFQQTNQHLIVVSRGTFFQVIEPLEFEINPESKEDFQALFDVLKDNDYWPQYIIYEWSTSQDQELNFYAPLKLLQTLGSYPPQTLHLGFLVQQLFKVFGNENISPEQALILGPARVANDEYPHLSSQCIDMQTPEPEVIMAEVLNAQSPVVAIRGNYRWLPSQEALNIPSDKQVEIKTKGTYLITGGLGGIGSSLAQHLIKNYQTKVILTSRAKKPLPSQLSPFKDNITLAQANVTRAEDMKQVLSTHPQVDGIIHAAGLAGMGLIQNKKEQEAARVLAVKVKGTAILSELAATHNIPWVLCCSALNSFLGGVGQVDYVSANAFMDAWCQKNDHCIALNWGTWQEVGMAVDTPWPANLPPVFLKWRQQLLKQGIKAQEGALALEKALQSGHSQIMVSSLPLEALKQRYKQLTLKTGFEQLQLELNPNSLPTIRHSRPTLDITYTPPHSSLEHTLVQIWQDYLGFEPIGIHDNFFELGGHSLLAVSMKAKLEEQLEQSLPLDIIFKGTTIANLAQAIIAQVPSTPSLIIPLKAGEAPTIYCIHAISGTVFPFQTLANQLNQRVQALQSPLLLNNTLSLNSVEEIASHYLNAFPHPPEILVGWSFGGLIAFEMAQQLQNNPLLILLDIAAPLTDRERPIIDEKILKERFLQDYQQMLNHKQGLTFEDEETKKLFTIFKTHVQAANQYNGQKYSGAIHLLKAKDSLFEAHPDSQSLDWEILCPSVTLETIPGDHYSMLKQSQLASYIQKVVQENV